jgi:hypothetical protein
MNMGKEKKKSSASSPSMTGENEGRSNSPSSGFAVERYELNEDAIFGSFGPALTRRDSISNIWSVPNSVSTADDDDDDATSTYSKLWLLHLIQHKIGSVWWEIDRVSAGYFG